MGNRKLNKQREIAAKLSRPKPIELPSGNWRCQVMVRGKRVEVVETDPQTAHAKALAIKAGLLEEEKSPANMTVGDAIDRYIESKDAVLSPSTIRGYKSMRQTVLAPICSQPLQTMTQETVQRFVNSVAKKHSPKYTANAHGLLSAAVKLYRGKLQLITTLPQKEKKEIRIPETKDIQFLVEKAKGTRFELPFLLAVWMGLRTSEIRGLTWDSIEGDMLHIKQAMVEGEDGPVIKLAKTYSGDRKIKIPEYIRQLLEDTPRKDEYIVHYSRNALYNHLRRMCQRYGIPHFRFHDLRHYHASVMLSVGVPDKYAMERMGHASAHMLKRVYQHTMKEKTEEITEQVDDFFNSKLHTGFHTKENES